MKKLSQIFSILLTFLFVFTLIVNAQNVILLEEGVNRLDDTLFVAQPGDIIELTTNGGVYYEYFSVLIDMPITIRAAEGLTTKPKIVTDDTRAIFTVRNDLTLIGLDLSGLGGDNLTGSAIRTDSMDVIDGYNLTIEDCYFHDFESSAIKANVETIAGDVIIDNCLFYNIGIAEGDEGIYFKNGTRAPGSATKFVCTNSTFWNTGAEAMYIEDHDNDIATPGTEFMINNLNVHNATDKSIYAHSLDNAILRDFIVSSDELDESIDPCRIFGTGSVAENFLDYNIDGISLQQGATVDSTKMLHNVDPMFLDASQGNFRLDASSPAVGFGTEGTTLGDPRWWPSTPQKITIDGLFNDWAMVEPLLVTENDPNITDSIDLKAAWIAVDDEKIAFRWDFFDDVEWNTEEEEGTYNRWQGWHRVYAEAQSDGIDKYFRLRSYYGDVDTTKFSRLRWDVQSDSLDYDPDEFDGTRFTGTMAFNEEGTSCEMYIFLIASISRMQKEI